MVDMILLQCEKGSKAARVACPQCGRISMQILKDSYTGSVSADFWSKLTCPICGLVSNVCSTAQAQQWESALSRFLQNSSAYNSAIKDNYARQQISADISQTSDLPSTKDSTAQSLVFASPSSADEQSKTEKNIGASQVSIFSDAVDPLERAVQPATIALEQNTDSNVSGLNEAISLERKISRWKKELLDTGKRNKMINYRETSRTTLKILEPGLEELFNKLAINEKELSFQRLINKDSDYRTYAMLALLETLSYSLPVHVGDIRTAGTIVEREKTLKNLRAKTKLAREEQGTNILYLSFGFILWKENSRSSAQWMKAPLLMMPVSLEMKSLNAPYTISRYDDDIEVNPTLDYLFNSEYGIDLPTFELKDKRSISEYLDTIEAIIDRRGWKLVREVSLGLLSFQKINMYHDLNNDYNQQLILQHPVLRAMGGDYAAVKGLPSDIQNFDFDAVEPKDWYQVINADSSQQEAILLSKRGVSFVMQGPPGTGKSQTITNIIAEALADGKKILFVSEKAAALQVVLKRLTEVGLSDFCLSLHDYKANKKVIIDNIGANLSLPAQSLSRSAMADLTELFYSRKALNEYADELHKRIQPFDGSIYAAYGRIVQLENASTVSFTVDNPLSITKETFSKMLYNVEMFERALHTIGGPLHENPWNMTTATSSGQTFKAQLSEQTNHLPIVLPEIEKAVAAINSAYGIDIKFTWQGVQGDLAEIRSVLDLPIFPVEWADSYKLATLMATAQKELEKQDEYQKKIDAFKVDYIEKATTAKYHQDNLIHQLNILHSKWTDNALELDADDIRARYGEAYAGEDDTIENCIRKSSEATEKVLADVRMMLRYLEQANEMLKLEQADSFEGMIFVSKIISILVNAPYMETVWFDPRKNADVVSIIDEACKHSESIRARTDKLLENWENGILMIDADGMLARFKTEYTGFLYKLKGDYKNDIKTLKLQARTVGYQISDESAVSVLREVKELNEEKAWFAENQERLLEVFKTQYKGIDTDWNKLNYGVTSALTIAEMFPYANIPPEVIVAIQNAVEDTAKAAKLRELNGEFSETRLLLLKKNIGNLAYIANFDDNSSVAQEVVSQLDIFLTDCLEQRKHLSTIQACRVSDGNHITYHDISDLLDTVDSVHNEMGWFEENNDVLLRFFSNHYIGETTDWDAIIEKLDITGAQPVRDWTIPFESRSAQLTELFGERYRGINTDWASTIHDLASVRNYLREKGSNSVVSYKFIGLICSDEDKRKDLKCSIDSLNGLIDNIEPEVNVFLSLFMNGETYRNDPIQELRGKYIKCMEGFDKLDQWIDYVETKRECDECGLSSFTAQIEKADNSIADVKDAFEKGFYCQWIIPALEQAPSVQNFRRRVHEQRLEKFTALDEAQFAIARDRIRDKIIRTFPDPYSVSGPRSEIGILRHEMEKKRRIMPLRKLFRTIPNLLLTLKPCLMMSPLSVAYFLEAESYHFDMVIFDEASQIFPQDAIGAILRADQVIIAGDTKQLPPTNFFTASTGNGTESYDLDADGEWEDEIYDSILEETANILPNRTLRWHYRSKSERLIAFSNQDIYQNELVTFPSINEQEVDSGVEFIYVEEGYYEGGGKNCNVLEAKRCVELVISHIEHHPDRSLGIIAFSEKQQQAILKEIQLFREKHIQYEEFFKEGKEEEFFVKNLENVQGDERDTIIFSVGYAKTKDQKAKGKPMAMRFGPLGVQGGERRLNVAITRAKRNVKLVSSILPSDIDLSRTESEGIRMLHDYIAFAMNSEISLVGSQRATAPDEFKTSVAEFLRNKGYSVRESVGCSGYKIDIAIKHPSQREEFVAGIECDGTFYALARTARDRDRLRKSVLTAMGWRMYRVWSTEWYKNSEIEGQKLVAFIDKAITAVDERIKREEEQKRLDEERQKAEQEKAQRAREKEMQERLLEEKQQKEAEQRRIEAARRAAEQRKEIAARERAKQITTDRQIPKDIIRSKAESDKLSPVKASGQVSSPYEWAIIGSKVKHKTFGTGTITNIDGKYIKIAFSSAEKTFSFPGAFEQGFLMRALEQSHRGALSDGNQVSLFGADTDKPADTKRNEDIYSELVSAGLVCIDNRKLSSIIWVIYAADKVEKFRKIVWKHGVHYTLEKRGSVATNNKPAWRIMIP